MSKQGSTQGCRNFKGKKLVRIVEENLEEPIHNIGALNNTPQALYGNRTHRRETTTDGDRYCSLCLLSKLCAKKLKQSQAKLKGYSGHSIKVIGEPEVNVCHNCQQATLPLVVVKGAASSLLGHIWLDVLQLDWKEIHLVGSMDLLRRPLDKYAEVFKEGLGELKGHEAKIQRGATEILQGPPDSICDEQTYQVTRHSRVGPAFSTTDPLTRQLCSKTRIQR